MLPLQKHHEQEEKKCLAPKVGYLMRTHPHEILVPTLDIFEAAIVNALESLGEFSLETSVLDKAWRRKVIHLPSRLGGLGVPISTLVAPIAYHCSTNGDSQKQRCEEQNLLMRKDLQLHLSRDLCEVSPRISATLFPPSIDHPKPRTNPVVFGAMLRNITGIPHAQLDDKTLTCEACSLASFPGETPLQWMQHVCGCVKRHGWNTSSTHNLLKQELARICHECGLLTDIEPQDYQSVLCKRCHQTFPLIEWQHHSCVTEAGEGKEPGHTRGADVRIYLSSSKHFDSIVVDVSIIRDRSKTNISVNSVEILISKREDEKFKFYGAQAKQAREELIPVVITSNGYFSTSTETLAKRIARESYGTMSHQDITDRLRCAVGKGEAYTLLAAERKLGVAHVERAKHVLDASEDLIAECQVVEPITHPLPRPLYNHRSRTVFSKDATKTKTATQRLLEQQQQERELYNALVANPEQIPNLRKEDAEHFKHLELVYGTKNVKRQQSGQNNNSNNSNQTSLSEDVAGLLNTVPGDPPLSLSSLKSNKAHQNQQPPQQQTPQQNKTANSNVQLANRNNNKHNTDAAGNIRISLLAAAQKKYQGHRSIATQELIITFNTRGAPSSVATSNAIDSDTTITCCKCSNKDDSHAMLHNIARCYECDACGKWFVGTCAGTSSEITKADIARNPFATHCISCAAQLWLATPQLAVTRDSAAIAATPPPSAENKTETPVNPLEVLETSEQQARTLLESERLKTIAYTHEAFNNMRSTIANLAVQRESDKRNKLQEQQKQQQQIHHAQKIMHINNRPLATMTQQQPAIDNSLLVNTLIDICCNDSTVQHIFSRASKLLTKQHTLTKREEKLTCNQERSVSEFVARTWFMKNSTISQLPIETTPQDVLDDASKTFPLAVACKPRLAGNSWRITKD